MTPHSSSPSAQSVLIVDQSDECREVLRTALQRRGLKTFEAIEARAGLALARQHRPDVIVLDLEAVATGDSDVRNGFDDQSRQENASLVILGTTKRPAAPLERTRFVTKPYHYAPLIRTIEKLLED